MDSLRSGDPRRVGSYLLVGRLGGGGMGQVFLGETPGGRKVVVKLIKPELARDAQFRERFAREIEAARRVGGFHTAQVVDADPGADPPWMVTSFIVGPSLQEAVKPGKPLPPEEVRTLGAGLAEGVAAIHAVGLVHRDIKPDNVILAADGPRIIDFGIARADGKMRLTTANHVFGTLPYMSPEQLAGDTAGPASDVFALGGVLAFAATSRPPFGEDSQAAIIYRVTSQPPDLRGLADRGLREMITGCLAKSPRDRPALSAILTALARPGLPPVILTAPTLTLASPKGFKIAFSPDGRLLAGVDIDGMVRLWNPATGEHLRTLTGGDMDVAFCPDGRLASLGGLDDSLNGTVRLWDPATGHHLRTLTDRGRVISHLAFSPDGRLLATGGPDGTVSLLDLASGERRRTLSSHKKLYETWVEDVAFSPDGRLVAVGFEDGTTRLWDPGSGEHWRDLPGDEYFGCAMAFSPDGRLLAIGHGDGTVRLWNPASGKFRRALTGHTHGGAVAFSPDGGLLATVGNADGTLRLWDPGSGEQWCTVRTSGGTDVAFSPGGGLLATAGRGMVRLWPLSRSALTRLRDVAPADCHVCMREKGL